MKRINDNGSETAVFADLRILATTDLHMHILPYDYLSDRPVSGWGLASTATLIEQARAETPNTILLDNGDFLHGTPMGDLVVEQYRAAAGENMPAIHPMIAAMDHLGYDAGTLGNHDFDRGIDVLFAALEQASFPIVSANTIISRTSSPEQDSTLVPPFTILDRIIVDDLGRKRLVKIGVIGFLPPGSLPNGSTPVASPDTRDIIEAARTYVPLLKLRGADVVVALAHSGIGDAQHSEGMENALLPLSRVPGIDAIVGGHSHQMFPGDDDLHQVDENGLSDALNRMPTVVPGFWGSHLGMIDLRLTWDENGWRVLSGTAALRKVEDEPLAADLSATRAADERSGARSGTTSPGKTSILPDSFRNLHDRTLTHMREEIATNAQDLNNYLALVGADRATRLVQMAMRDRAWQLLRDTELQDIPVLAASAPFKSGGLAGPGYYTDVPKGKMTQRAISDLYIFPNALLLARVSGASLRRWLERSASLFGRVAPGERLTMLKDDAVPGYMMETVLGVTYQIDLTKPAAFTPSGGGTGGDGGRVVDLRCNGRLVEDADQFVLASSDFRARGGGGYPALPVEDVIATPHLAIRSILKDYVRSVGTVEVPATPLWSFTPVPGASVCFKSSPDAMKAAQGFPWLSITCVHQTDEAGFAHYEMEL